LGSLKLSTFAVAKVCGGIKESASAQPLDFLARTKNSSFPNWKPIVSHPEFPDGH
jgi:hypothetical protein